MAGKITLDSNMLLYAIDVSEGSKHSLAAGILVKLARSRPPLMLQCMNEFAAVAIRKKLATSDEIARTLTLCRNAFPIVPPSVDDLEVALAARAQDNLSFWDALLWAGARRAGAQILLSEDFQDGRKLGGVQFVNPFKLTRRALDALLS